MEGVKDPLSIFQRQSDASVCDGDCHLTLGSRSRTNRQCSSPVFHRFNGIQHQVHEHLLKLHPISQNVRHVFVELELDFNGVPQRFLPKQGRNFSSDFSKV